MVYFRPADERGHVSYGWLNSYYSFSFAHYFDLKHMGFSVLRVINDDFVTGGAGFDAHGHRDMEIISYVQSGVMEHKDNLGNHFAIPAGEVQRMSAGTGITHSEFNQSKSEPLKFLQIWILPDKTGITPSYAQASIQQNGALTPLVTPLGDRGSLTINQDVSVYRVQLHRGENLDLTLLKRAGYLHVVRGPAQCCYNIGSSAATEVKQKHLNTGDGVGIVGPGHLSLSAANLSLSDEPFEALWFDLPALN